MDPTISVIIPAYNASGTIGACLDALERQTIPREEYEIIVVDDGSTDDTRAAARRPDVAVLTQAHQGQAAARNLGVQSSRGDLLFFTDADCMPSPDWLEQMRAAFDDPRVDGVKGVYRTRQRAIVARFVQLEYEDKYDRLYRRETIDFVDTYSAGYRRRPFEAIGGFDPTMCPAEDQELSFRMAAHGARLVFRPSAVVEHLHAASLRAYARKKFRGGFAKFRVVSRHKSKWVGDAHTPPVMKVQMALVVLGAVCAVAGLLSRPARLVAALAGAAFGITTLPLIAKMWVRDRAVATAAPVILIVRAAALSAGAIVSFLETARSRLQHVSW